MLHFSSWNSRRRIGWIATSKQLHCSFGKNWNWFLTLLHKYKFIICENYVLIVVFFWFCAGSSMMARYLLNSSNRASMRASTPVSLGFTWGTPVRVVWWIMMILPCVFCYLFDRTIRCSVCFFNFYLKIPSGYFVMEGYGISQSWLKEFNFDPSRPWLNI